MKFKYILGGINWGVIMLIAFGGIMLFQAIPEDIISLKPAISFEDMLDEETEIKAGARVSGKVPYVFDVFASEETYTRYKDGSRSGGKASGAYYLVPTADAFIAIKGRQADVGVLDDLIDETWNYLLTGEEKHLSPRQFDADVALAKYHQQGGKCAICGQPKDFKDMHADHIVPWSKGGKTVPENCQMLCIPCNEKKKAH